MTVGTFDTLEASRDLTAAGMDRTQAEAVAAVIRRGQGDLATRGDIRMLRSDLGTLRSDFRTLQWAVGLLAAMTLATFAGVIAILTLQLPAA